ncbi:DUF805 domain-containing protein [Streptomyces diastatochromogenes]|uniref:DUF805 domain-containing protein n=1 Tax=Streptomyces diastatochromogenes TaxID=42236 RepID=A0A233S1W2_STRDA|nr:DUF805 domain-containing protein [Streptomyces diastatochromogenes]MCZ0991576.1 DUF805 domain-containing protein [Streptomyces diastatochromogenes]OXY89645.1 hypothetical protein BEK98_37140 [Streptomyces diastatochromogenes]
MLGGIGVATHSSALLAGAGIAVLVLLLPTGGTVRSARWIFIHLVPTIGAIVLLVLCSEDSKAGANQYGPNPKKTRALA